MKKIKDLEIYQLYSFLDKDDKVKHVAAKGIDDVIEQITLDFKAEVPNEKSFVIKHNDKPAYKLGVKRLKKGLMLTVDATFDF